MRILFVSRLYEPRNIIGAVRPTQLTKYFASFGNEVFCATEDFLEKDYSIESFPSLKILRVQTGPVGKYSINHSKKANLLRINNSSITDNKNKVQKPSFLQKIIKRMRRFAAQIMHLIDELEWSRRVYKMIKKNYSMINPDVLISSYGPESSVIVGLLLKKKYPDLFWISDMRDPMTHSQQSVWYKWINNKIELKMLKKSNVITTISFAIGDKYKNKCKKIGIKDKTVEVFENGFVENDKNNNLSIDDGILRIGYTGALYNGRRKMDALFEAIDVLEKKYKKSLPIEIHYAGGDADEIFRQADLYNKKQYVVNHGLISQDKALLLQEKCDILCVVSWNTKEEKGVLTGKFPEYLRLRKLILALISGEVPNAELSMRIKKMNIGFSYEYSSNNGMSELVEWLNDCIIKKVNYGYCGVECKNEIIEMFNYANISKRYETFIKFNYQR